MLDIVISTWVIDFFEAYIIVNTLKIKYWNLYLRVICYCPSRNEVWWHFSLIVELLFSSFFNDSTSGSAILFMN